MTSDVHGPVISVMLDPFGHLWLVGDRSRWAPLAARRPAPTSSTNPPAGRPLDGHQVGGRVEVGGVLGLRRALLH